MYLCSSGYNPQREHTICATDPALGIDWPLVDGAAPSLSDRDAAAPSFEEVRAAGLLPTWAETQKFLDDMRNPPRESATTDAFPEEPSVVTLSRRDMAAHSSTVNTSAPTLMAACGEGSQPISEKPNIRRFWTARTPPASRPPPRRRPSVATRGRPRRSAEPTRTRRSPEPGRRCRSLECAGSHGYTGKRGWWRWR